MDAKTLINRFKNSSFPRTEYLIYVMNAFLCGKTIQAWNPELNKWEDVNGEPSWGWSRVEYRIKE